MAKALGFGAANFGWHRNADDSASLDALIVDSYLNVNEHLFDIAGISAMMLSSGLDAFSPYGITTESRGYLFDVALEPRSPFAVQWTDLSDFLHGAEAVAAYRRLGLREQCRMIELAYRPNGYTVLGYRRAVEHRFASSGRVMRNALDV